MALKNILLGLANGEFTLLHIRYKDVCNKFRSLDLFAMQCLYHVWRHRLQLYVPKDY
jgi:hypothetical protein